MNVLFLDYDGVVNTPIWGEGGVEDPEARARFYFPDDGKVNNFQAVQWVANFCLKYNYKIVVSSTWREEKSYAEYLYAGGLPRSVEVLGRTPLFHECQRTDSRRGAQIQQYLREHKGEVDRFIIVDDDVFDFQEMGFEPFYVNCDPLLGFTINQFYQTERIHQTVHPEHYHEFMSERGMC